MLQFSDYVKNSKKNINENDLLIIFGAGIVGRLTFEALKEKADIQDNRGKFY